MGLVRKRAETLDDGAIVALYWQRDERAIQETDIKYRGFLLSIARNFVRDLRDGEECLNDTYIGAWNAIPPTRPNSLRIFLGRITRNLALSRWRRKTADCRGAGEVDLALDELAECVGSGSNPEQLVQTQELDRIVNTFLRAESDINRAVFLRRYFYLESSKEIALRLGTSDSNVRMILSRTRKRLREYLKKEGYIA